MGYLPISLECRLLRSTARKGKRVYFPLAGALSCRKSALSSAAWRADTSHDTCTPEEVGATSNHDAEEEENRKDTGDKHHRVLPSILGRLGRVPDVTPQPIAPADVLIRGSPARRLTEEAEFSSAGSTRKPV